MAVHSKTTVSPNSCSSFLSINEPLQAKTLLSYNPEFTPRGTNKRRRQSLLPVCPSIECNLENATTDHSPTSITIKDLNSELINRIEEELNPPQSVHSARGFHRRTMSDPGLLLRNLYSQAVSSSSLASTPSSPFESSSLVRPPSMASQGFPPVSSSASQNRKRRRPELLLTQKLALLEDHEKGMPNNLLGLKYYGNRRHTSGVVHIIANQELVKAAAQKLTLSGQKERHRILPSIKPTDPIFERMLLIWIQVVRGTTCPLPLNLSLVREQAMLMRDRLILKIKQSNDLEKLKLIQTFIDHKCSPTWCRRFMHDNHLVKKKLFGEAGAIDIENVDPIKERFKKITSKYDLENIYNIDECALYYKRLPDITLTSDPNSRGLKVSKDRITLVLACNATGSHKLTPFVIGSSRQPEILEEDHNHHLMKYYRSTHNGWMQTTLFRDWLTDLNNEMVLKNKHILLLLDNAPVHTSATDFYNWSNIQLAYFPPNMTCLLQPLDAGIIRTVKALYKKYAVKILLDEFDLMKGSRKINLADAITLILKCWDEVSIETIQHCWHHTGILMNKEQEIQSQDSHPENVIDHSLLCLKQSEVAIADLLSSMKLSQSQSVTDDTIINQSPITETLVQEFIQCEITEETDHVIEETMNLYNLRSTNKSRTKSNVQEKGMNSHFIF